MNNYELNNMFDWLMSFAEKHAWDEHNVPEQTRAVFTTVCLMGNIDADTSVCDSLVRDLWRVFSNKSFVDLYDFMDYMVELLVY